MLRNGVPGSDCRHDADPSLAADPITDRFTVFLVHDDAAVLVAMSNLLRSAGYQTKTFSSPITFLAFLAAHDRSVPGCAVLDVFMPHLDGLQLQASLTAQGVQKPIIFMTGCGDVPTSVRAMKAGAIDFLPKPVHEADLLAAIARAESKEAEARQIYHQRALDQGQAGDAHATRAGGAGARGRRPLEQADRLRPRNRQEAHQGAPQSYDAQDGRSDRRRARSADRSRRHGVSAQLFPSADDRIRPNDARRSSFSEVLMAALSWLADAPRASTHG